MRAGRSILSEEEKAAIRRKLDETPALNEVAHLFHLAGNATRLKILYLLELRRELSVGELARAVGFSPSAVSQHLAKLRGAGLVAMRRHRQTIYTRLAVHAFNICWREEFFRESTAPGSRFRGGYGRG
jgi:DNA-binding transcriptional ArsR family regulator